MFMPFAPKYPKIDTKHDVFAQHQCSTDEKKCANMNTELLYGLNFKNHICK